MNGLAEQVPLSGPVGSPSPETGLTLRHALLFALGYAPLLVAFFLNLWARPHYQFFPLALAGAAFLAWTRLKDLRNRPPADGPRRSPLVTCHSPPATGHLPLALLAVSFLVLVTATLYWSPWLGSLAAIIGLLAVIWVVGGKQRLQALAPALVLGLVIIPPPLALDVRFADSLRVLAVNWSSHLLDLLSVTHSQSGNIIELPTQKLLVEEACSGINSVLITLAGCLFYMLWRRASIICTVISLVGTVSFVLLGNVGRITLGAWLKFRHGIEILSGWPHQPVGLLLFAMYMVLIFSLDRWLVFLTSPLPSRKRQRPPGAAQPPSASLPPQPATSNLPPPTPPPPPLSPPPSSARALGGRPGLDPPPAEKTPPRHTQLRPASGRHLRPARANRRLAAAQFGIASPSEGRDLGRLFPGLAFPTKTGRRFRRPGLPLRRLSRRDPLLHFARVEGPGPVYRARQPRQKQPRLRRGPPPQ